jgi:hypothetical protein
MNAVQRSIRWATVNERRKVPFRSGHTEFVQAIVVNAEVVAYFVQYGEANLIANVIVVMADGLDITLVDANPVGKDEVVVLAAMGEGDAVVEPEKEMALVEVGGIEIIVARGVFDDEVDVVDLAAERLGYLVESLADQPAEVCAFQG